MIRSALWIVGPPAAGKTTLTRAFLGDPATYTIVRAPKWTTAQAGAIVAAGHYTGDTFDGADRVAYNGVHACLSYWAEQLREAAEVTIFDGDRFSHAKCVEWVRFFVDEVRVMYLDAPADVLAARRAARGWNPNPAWLAGRVTKAQRFARSFT